MGSAITTKIDSVKNDLLEIYRGRSILYSLIRKELIGKYRNSTLGFLWHFVMPAMMLAVYYVVFNAGIKASPIDNFIVFLSSGLFPFTFMTSCLTGGAGCVSSNSGMIKKMYFPREILVLAYTISNFIIMVIGYCVVFVVIIIIGYELNVFALLFVPIILILTFIFATGYTFLFSALNVYKRDVQYFLSSISMVFMFVTPMYFILDNVKDVLHTIVLMNPFTYYIETLHSCVYYGTFPNVAMLSIATAMAVVSLLIGLVTFRKLKRGFSERL